MWGGVVSGSRAARARLCLEFRYDASAAKLAAGVYSIRMRVVVGLPAYNEARTIRSVIGGIPVTLSVDAESVDADVEVAVEVVVVDDGSSDGTASEARQAGAHVVRHAQNAGVGTAFQTLYRYALERSADILVTLDADGQFDAADIPKLIAPIVEGRALVCTASRFLRQELAPRMPAIKRWGNARVAHLVSSLTGQRYADVSCGFRAYSREALLRLTVYHSFTYTHETFLDLAAKRIPIVEVPLSVRGTREFGESRVASSVLRYGLRTALIILRTYRDHQPLRLCSWLALLWALVGSLLLGGSFAAFLQTDSWLKWAALSGGAFWGIAVATLFFGFMADMATRQRLNQEEILYWLRRRGSQSPPWPAGRTGQTAVETLADGGHTTNARAAHQELAPR